MANNPEKKKKKKKPHAIMISVPYQGHINPFVNLALKLATRGVAVTFVHFQAVHHRLSNFHHIHPDHFDFFKDAIARQHDVSSSAAAAPLLDIRYTTIDDGLDPVHYDRDVNFEEYWEIIMRQFQPRVDDFVAELISRSDPDLAHFLVADTVFGWPAATAKKLNLVNVSFWTQPALVFSVAYHLDLMKENGHYPYTDDNEVEINYIPGVKISSKDLMSFVKEPMERRIINRSTYETFRDVKAADFILHNTVEELETETLSALNKLRHPSYAIGPINFSKNLPAIPTIKSLWSESDCTSWLATKPPGTVLYVSFGSFVHLEKELLQELAYGLLLSEVNFIWVIREGILGSNNGEDQNLVLPKEYKEDVGDRGLIIPWCNQVGVLSNPGVGGFLTHNGWNSTVESVWCGVPMMCYPMLYDQPANRKLVVDDWGVGINLCDGGGQRRLDRVEVGEKIKRFMSGETAVKLRDKADEVKETLKKAVEIDGSSERNFDRFLADLKARIHC